MSSWVHSIRRLLMRQPSLCLWGSILGASILVYIIFYRELKIETFQFHLNSDAKRWELAALDPTRAYELRWRMLWGLSALSVVSVALLNAFWSIETISRYRIGRSPAMWFGVALCAIAMMYVSWVKGWGGKASDDILQLYSSEAHIRLKQMVQILVALVLAVVVLIAAGMVALLARPDDAPMDVTAITDRHWDFRRSLMACTALLVVLVIETYFLFRLATVGVDPEIGGPIAATLTVGGSTSYTVLLVILYGPTAIALNQWSWSVAAKELDTFEVPKLQDWLRQHGIDSSPMRVASGALMACLPATVGATINFLPRIF